MARTQVLRHMAPKDIPLFASYLFTPEGQTFTAWEFDVLVGDPEDPGVFYPPNVRRQALYLNALKIDAVGWLFSTPALIECKPNAGLNALGQILGYQKWYQIIFGTKPRGIIVCQRMTRQVETLCTIDEIDVRRVTPASDFTVERAIEYVKPRIKTMSVLPQMTPVSL